MPNPTRPNQFCDAIPSANADLCTRFSKLLNLPSLLCDLFTWMFDSTGSPSAEFQAQVATYAVPTGTIIYSLTQNMGAGWLLADGSEVSRTTYSALFAAIGTRYGDGDASTTFNLPDLRGRSPIGAGTGTGLTSRNINDVTVGEENHTLSIAELPAHNHSINKPVNVTGENGTGVANHWRSIDPTGVTGNTGGGNSHNTIHPCVIAYAFVKT